jgi:hypothetical protein
MLELFRVPCAFTNTTITCSVIDGKVFYTGTIAEQEIRRLGAAELISTNHKPQTTNQ